MQHSDRLRQSLDQTIDVLIGGMRKVLEQNPSWEDLPTLLTPDELRLWCAFVESMAALRNRAS